MTVTFRSDSSGSSLGFFGILTLQDKDDCLRRRKRQQRDRYGDIEVPSTSLCKVKDCVRRNVYCAVGKSETIQIFTTLYSTKQHTLYKRVIMCHVIL